VTLAGVSAAGKLFALLGRHWSAAPKLNGRSIITARRFAPVVIAVVAALLPAVSTAGSSYSTKIVVSLRVPAFHGTLKSGKRACARRRTVKLFREKPGRDKLLGTDRSSPKARWSIPIGRRLTSGSYYATAPAKGSCKPAKSKVLTIG
jgi:hypothetical protein